MPHFKVHGYLINSESKIVISFQMVMDLFFINNKNMRKFVVGLVTALVIKVDKLN